MLKNSLNYVLFIFLTGCASSNWNKPDIALEGIYTYYHLIDWSQTLRISEDKGIYECYGRCEFREPLYETNPILGEKPSRSRVNYYFASTLIARWMISGWLNRPYRNVWQGLGIWYEERVTSDNKRLGLKGSIDF